MTFQHSILALACVLFGGLAGAQEDPHAGHDHAPGEGHDHAEFVRRTAPWPDETLELFGSLPVQDGGRIKPMDTYAGFQLLKTNGKRTIRFEDGTKLGATEWLLDCLFFPEQAREYEVFLIQNSEVLTAIGLEFDDKRKRDRHSYDALVPGREELYAQASDLFHKEPLLRTPLERQLVELASNLRDFERHTHLLDFAYNAYSARGSAEVAEALGGESVPLSVMLRNADRVSGLYMDKLKGGATDDDPDVEPILRLFSQLEFFMKQSEGSLALFPPELPVERETEWMNLSELIPNAMTPASITEKVVSERSLDLVAALEGMVEHRAAQPAAFQAELQEFHQASTGLAALRGEYEGIQLERTFYNLDLFWKALYCFVAAFLLVAFSWLRPRSFWLQLGIWATLSLGTGLATYGIVLRCIIRGRPPVTTLYETILFIAVCAVIVAIAIEVMNRQRIALATATLLGAGGMWLSTKYELKEAISAGDTMPSLVAVLDTNFWLSTHVTTVTLGYSAGLLAAALGVFWVMAKVLGIKAGDRAFYRHVARMIYGVICFGLLFSVVGTILGGIWANYSWGRFWGWDPKENGALLICLFELMILHARLGGYIKDRGLACCAIFGGMVVSFSWWGVNLLGIGLHSYGFTSGVFASLLGYWATQAVVLAISLGHWLVERGAASASTAEPALE